jgi:hypothetical protein
MASVSEVVEPIKSPADVLMSRRRPPIKNYLSMEAFRPLPPPAAHFVMAGLVPAIHAVMSQHSHPAAGIGLRKVLTK